MLNMTSDLPTTIRVEHTESAEIRAIGARLDVKVIGRAAWFESSAARRSTETTELLGSLSDLGLDAGCVSLQGVPKQDPDSAACNLRIRIVDLGLLQSVVDLLSSNPQTRLERIGWWFDENAARQTLASTAVDTARKRAESISTRLGLMVTRVVSVADKEGAASLGTRHEGYAPLAEEEAGVPIIGTRTLLHSIVLEVEAAPP